MEMLTQGWEFAYAALGPLGPLYVLGFLGFLMILMTAPLLFRTKPDPLNKLKGSGPIAQTAKGKDGPAVRLRYDSGGRQLERFKPYLEPTDQKELSQTKLKLMQAGYRSRNAVSTYHLFRFLRPVMLPVAGFQVIAVDEFLLSLQNQCRKAALFIGLDDAHLEYRSLAVVGIVLYECPERQCGIRIALLLQIPLPQAFVHHILVVAAAAT